MGSSTKEEQMFRVTVDGESQEWMSLEYALTDALSRGFNKTWTIEKGQVV
jgi:hypothetical protein